MFRNFIEQYIKLSDDEWEIINRAFERKLCAKNELILSEGQVCRYFYFLQTGLVRFFTMHDGNEVTKFFTAAPYCFTSRDSFRNQTPSSENIQMLEESILWYTTFNNMTMLQQVNSWNIFTKKLLQEIQDYTEELLMEIKMKTADERYLNLLNKRPDVLQRIPLKYLASFLNIAPQSLSRIRKEIYKSKN